MYATLGTKESRQSAVQALVSLFQRPRRLQIAALCYRVQGKRLEVLMVTSRDTGRWILPKGWPIMSRRAHKTAEVEAFEEAGVIGQARKKSYVSFGSYKGLKGGFKVPTNVLVYLVKVETQVEEYPEKLERQQQWFSVDDAILIASEPGIKMALRRLKDDSSRFI